MGEAREPSRSLAVFFMVLIAAITVAVLNAPRSQRPSIARSDVMPPAGPILPTVDVWLSTADHRKKLTAEPSVAMTEATSSPADIVIDSDVAYQSIVGFGAAMTDSSAWLLHNTLGEVQRDALMKELYGSPPGLNFNMMRLTIGASDFSPHFYTLDDLPFGATDPDLKHFNVAENIPDLIPVVQESLAINPGLRIVASPWSAPVWMKTSENLIGGELLETYEGAYADYLVRYVDAYRRHGIPIYALTLQNEPRFSPISYLAMPMSPQTRARIIGRYLGPKLAGRSPRTRILEWDHNWSHPEEPLAVLGDPDAAPYVDGVAWHCYEGSQHEQGTVHRAHPDKDTFITECSGGDWPLSMNGELLWFTRNLLVTGTRQWARGVIYWNLALDENHGPHFGGCAACKGVITVDSTTGRVSRNDEYYALGHFSRFVLPGAVRIKSNDTDAEMGLANVAFRNETDGSIVLVLVNIRTEARTVSVVEGGRRFEYRMPAESVGTFVWNPEPFGRWLRLIQQWSGPIRNPPRVE
ncbi:glucosylceramidase [Luteibacter sp. 1214]|uniref:glycoside hydrolase family 30 protein n=1 Tax=Luteibacter sp. 1214 TaxID=2817735 RepID=UPI002855CD36|nr:glycoside hydrolase family 30 beta sandwich domain-containing protein [Luteibacter sp. 1214]MDR6642258.1 glucosylceramidase [Luteibacter sp. 1214]